jgi:nucleoside-diphosphate-sugar epimerase
VLLRPAALATRAPLVPSIAQWVNAGRVPVLMDTTKARRELGWTPRYSSREILGELVSSQT